MKNVLVTGCSGFIGQHVVNALIAKGIRVRGVDITPFPAVNAPTIDFRPVNLTEPEAVTDITKGIDTVIHLAAIPREDRSKSYDEFLSVNVEATARLLDDAQRNSVSRFVFISTVEAAGFGNGTAPRTEIDPPEPVNAYGKSKRAAEERIMGTSEWTMEKVIVRLPMIYGPGTEMIDAKLFGMVKRRFYPLIGKGTARMEFCYIENAVTGILLAATHKAAAGELFYLSDQRSYTIKEVITAVAAGVGVPITFIHIPVPLAYTIALLWEIAAKLFPYKPFIMPASKKPFFSRETVWWTTRDVNTVSTEKIRQQLGYNATISIEEGCKKTAQWFALRKKKHE